MSLLEDIKTEEARAEQVPCSLCEYIEALLTTAPATGEALRHAAAGNLSQNALSRVLQKNQTEIGWRTVKRHRQEGH